MVLGMLKAHSGPNGLVKMAAFPSVLGGLGVKNCDPHPNPSSLLRVPLLGWFSRETKRKADAILWMDKILHHFETKGHPRFLVFTGESSFKGFLGGAGLRPSTVGVTHVQVWWCSRQELLREFVDLRGIGKPPLGSATAP